MPIVSASTNSSFLRALTEGRRIPRTLAVLSLITSISGVVILIYTVSFHLSGSLLGWGRFLLTLGAVLSYATQQVQKFEASNKSRHKLIVAERLAKANPDKPQLAWDVARQRLESYLAQNVSQVRSIFMLTLVVMAVGFVLICTGAYTAFSHPDKFQASELSVISGVVVSFIGGTFLVIYRATMAQATEYVAILERINAVGMSVQVLETLNGADAVKQVALAEVAKQLLQMYSHTPATKPLRGRAGKSSSHPPRG